MELVVGRTYAIMASILTTYSLLFRDAEILMPIEWHMIVLDEAQAIKNPTTRATQIVCDLQSRHRLCFRTRL